jgi:hypothetical protein
LLHEAEQVNPRADSDEETGNQGNQGIYWQTGTKGCRPGKAWAGCKELGGEAEAGAMGVEAGSADRERNPRKQ